MLSSVRPILIRIAHEEPQYRSVLLPYLVTNKQADMGEGEDESSSSGGGGGIGGALMRFFTEMKGKKLKNKDTGREVSYSTAFKNEKMKKDVLRYFADWKKKQEEKAKKEKGQKSKGLKTREYVKEKKKFMEEGVMPRHDDTRKKNIQRKKDVVPEAFKGTKERKQMLKDKRKKRKEEKKKKKKRGSIYGGLVRLAHSNPDLRGDLLPLIKKANQLSAIEAVLEKYSDRPIANKRNAIVIADELEPLVNSVAPNMLQWLTMWLMRHCHMNVCSLSSPKIRKQIAGYLVEATA